MKSRSKRPRARSLSLLFLVFALAPPAAARAAEWRAIGPYGGSVQEVERCIAQPLRAYAYSPVGGMFRSDDGGLSWRGISRGLAGHTFSDLAVNPSNPNSAWLVSSYFGGPTTLFHTRDGGSHWNPVNAPNDTSQIAVAPGDGNVIYLGGRSGLFKSLDGGATWRHASRGFDLGYGVVSIAVDLVQPTLVYAAVRGSHPGIYVSRNAGASWRRTLPRFLGDISKLRADPHLAGAVVGSTFYGLLRSLDAGQTWHPFGPSGGGAGFLDFAFGAGRPSNVLFLLYSGSTFVFEVDGRTERSARLTDDPEPIDALSISPDPRGAGRVLVGGLYGLRRTADGGVTWLDANQGFAARNIGRVAALGRTNLLAGNQRTEDGGGHWAPFLTDQRVVDLAPDPTDPRTVYAAATLGTIDGTLDRVWKSTDAGVTWQLSSTGINISEPAALAVDSLRPEKVYLATTFSYYDGDFYGGLFQSDDAGATWQRNEGLGRRDVPDVELDASGCVVVALGTSIQRSCDSGSTWTTLLDGSNPEVDAEGSLQEVEVAPSDARWIYASEGYRSEGPQRMWRSKDGGTTFEAVELPLAEFPSGIASSALAVDSSHPDVVYLALNDFGIGGGVWRRRGDAPWEKLSENLFNPAVFALRFDARPRPRLLASTGAGVQILDLGSAP